MSEPVFHRLADRDYFEALEWYSEQKPNVTARLVDAVKAAYERVMKDRLNWPFYENTPFRYIRVRKFPYLLIFQPYRETICIIAIHHTSRDSNYLMARS